MLSHEEIDRRMDVFMETCRREGVKVTLQRMEVFREVASTEEHPDAETVYRRVRNRIPTVSLDTVYRTLSLLDKLDLLSRVHVPSDRGRFDANMRPHHHFYCRVCGLLRDFYISQETDFDIPAEVFSWGEVNSVQVQALGICSECAVSKESDY